MPTGEVSSTRSSRARLLRRSASACCARPRAGAARPRPVRARLTRSTPRQSPTRWAARFRRVRAVRPAPPGRAAERPAPARKIPRAARRRSARGADAEQPGDRSIERLLDHRDRHADGYPPIGDRPIAHRPRAPAAPRPCCRPRRLAVRGFSRRSLLARLPTNSSCRRVRAMIRSAPSTIAASQSCGSSACPSTAPRRSGSIQASTRPTMLPSRSDRHATLTIGRCAVLLTNRSDTTGRRVAIASLSPSDSESRKRTGRTGARIDELLSRRVLYQDFGHSGCALSPPHDDTARRCRRVRTPARMRALAAPR